MPKVFRVEVTNLSVDGVDRILFFVSTPDPKDGTFATISVDEFVSYLSK